jgi:predicted acetyltransferase
LTFEVRAAKAEEIAEMSRVAATALGVPAESPWDIPPEWTLCAFEDGRLATSYFSMPWTMYFNGKETPVAAVAGVGTLPVYRRRGYLRRVVTTHFERLHEQGSCPIAILYPSQGAIYQRYGYAFVSTHNRYDFGPRSLEFTDATATGGSLVEAGDGDLETLSDIYEGFASERTGYVRRGPDRWRDNVLRTRSGRVLTTIIYREAGTARGYLVYDIQATGPGAPRQRITVRDMAYPDLAAYRAFWDYLRSLDLIGRIEWPSVPSDDPLPQLLLDWRRLGVTSPGGLMARIVDVQDALKQRTYSADARLTFEVRDYLCPWNEGRWEMETESGEASISRTTASPDLVMPVKTLASLVFNHLNAFEAARAGQLDVHESKALETWNRVMRTTYRPFCADQF